MVSMFLISFICDMVFVVYVFIKESYLYVKIVCDVVEKGVRIFMVVVVSGV